MSRIPLLGFALSMFLLPAIAAAKPPVATYDGCQGEACDCFAAYAEARNAGRPADFPIPVVRGAAVYPAMDAGAKPLGRIAVGSKARSLGQSLAVVDRGDYVVRKLAKPHPQVRIGDRVDTLISEGEGDIRVLHKGKWVSFSEGDVELRMLRKTVVQAWTRVAVGPLEGWAPGTPFQGCLE